ALPYPPGLAGGLLVFGSRPERLGGGDDLAVQRESCGSGFTVQALPGRVHRTATATWLAARDTSGGGCAGDHRIRRAPTRNGFVRGPLRASVSGGAVPGPVAPLGTQRPECPN